MTKIKMPIAQGTKIMTLKLNFIYYSKSNFQISKHKCGENIIKLDHASLKNNSDYTINKNPYVLTLGRFFEYEMIWEHSF